MCVCASMCVTAPGVRVACDPAEPQWLQVHATRAREPLLQIIPGNLWSLFCRSDQIYLREKNPHRNSTVFAACQPCKSRLERERAAATPLPCAASLAGRFCSWGIADAHSAADTSSLSELGQRCKQPLVSVHGHQCYRNTNRHERKHPQD